MSNEITYLIEKQAARIAELEAERDNFYMEYRMKCDVETKQLHEQLAALRRKIDEAPVVEVLDENPPGFNMSVVNVFLPIGTKLVNKEDLA